MGIKKTFISILAGLCMTLAFATLFTACNEKPIKDSPTGNLGMESLGLEYALNEDNNSYSVVSVGTCQDTDIVIPSKYKDKPITIIRANAFNGYTALTSITIPESVIYIGGDAFCGTAYYNNEENWKNDVLYIGKYLICAKTTISGACTIKDGTKHIASSAFKECAQLTNITMPESVTTMGSAVFFKCRKLKNVVLSPNLTSIDSWTFYWCDNLSSIEIPDSVTFIGGYAFGYCSKLKDARIGNGVTSIESQAFYECKSLTSIKIPNSVESIGHEAFMNCYNLVRVDIGNGLRFIGNVVFGQCLGLESVYITDIEAWCNIPFESSSSNPIRMAKKFYLNDELITELVIPETVAEIHPFTFSECRQLTSVVIPSSVKHIDNCAFEGCIGLTSVYYKGTVKDWQEIDIEYGNNLLTYATRYYYSETEPSLNTDGTAYEGSYWRYVDEIPTVWSYKKD